MIKQIYRGCGDMPHVGSHPGTGVLFIFILMGGLAGAKGGFAGFLGGAAIMGFCMLPLFLYGAYDRANLSDKLEKQKC